MADTLTLQLSYALTLVDPAGLTPAIDWAFWFSACVAGCTIALAYLVLTK